MKILNEIHSIIHSLNKKEKQLFTQLAGLSGDRLDKRYYKLFQVLAEMPTFDENLLNETFLTKLSAKQIAEDKQYLTEKLIIVLNLRDKSTNKKIQISKHLSKAFLLKNYNAYHLALRELDKGLELAHEENALSFIYIMTEFKYSILGTINKDVDFKETNLELEKTLEKMQRVHLIAKYTIKLRELILRKNKYKESNNKIDIEALIAEWEELNLKPLHNDTIDFMELNLKTGFYMSSENYLLALENAERGVEIIEKDIHKEHIACFTILTYFSNIIRFSLKLNDERKARFYLKKSYDLIELVKIHKNENLNKEVKFNSLQLKLEIEFFMRNYHIVAEEKNNILLVFKDYSQFIRHRLHSAIRVAWSLVYLKEFKNAYLFTQQELTIKDTKENYEFNLSYYCIKSVIEIITGDFLTAENTLRNLTRFIRQNSADLEPDVNIYKLLNAYLSFKVGKGSKLKIERQFQKLNIESDNLSIIGLIHFFKNENII